MSYWYGMSITYLWSNPISSGTCQLQYTGLIDTWILLKLRGKILDSMSWTLVAFVVMSLPQQRCFRVTKYVLLLVHRVLKIVTWNGWMSLRWYIYALQYNTNLFTSFVFICAIFRKRSFLSSLSSSPSLYLTKDPQPLPEQVLRRERTSGLFLIFSTFLISLQSSSCCLPLLLRLHVTSVFPLSFLK